MARSLLALLLLVAALAVAGCGDDDDSGSQHGGDSPATSETTSESASEAECRDVEYPKPKKDGGQQRPTSKLDPSGSYDVTFETNCGDFTIRLDVGQAPNTTASFASLVRKGFYDETVFHRIVPGFVIQGGDPTGSGTGGPGYKTVDKPPANASYTRGVVSMAKTASEPPGTSGSQFYVVSGPDAGLPPDYAIIGKVSEGLDTIARIEKLGDPNSGGTGTPLKPVVVEKATLSES